MPPGRPPKERRVRAFDGPGVQVPAEVVLDTSFVIEALVDRQPLHGPAGAFLTELAAQRSAVYYSLLLETRDGVG